MLPNWLKQLAAECPEEDRRQLEQRIGGHMALTQVQKNKRALDKLKSEGIIQRAVRYPERDHDRVRAYCAKLVKAHRRERQSTPELLGGEG